MNIYSDKINCYIEGIKIPVISFKSQYKQNRLGSTSVTIPIGGNIHPRMWASALMQITYLDHDFIGTMIEKLLFEGWASQLNINEDQGIMDVYVESKYSCLNYNTTLDYVAPKRYGLQKLDEGIVIYLGNEDSNQVTIDTGTLDTGYKLSERYMYVSDEDVDLDVLDIANTDTEKLYYIINKIPLAEKYANILFDQMDYSNFALTQAPVDRLNILSKIDPSESQRDEAFDKSAVTTMQLSEGINIKFDIERTALEQLYIGDLKDPGTEEVTQPGNKLTHSGKAVNFADYSKNNPKGKYVATAYGGDKKQKWCTPQSAEACLNAAETIYNKYQSIVNVGDWSELNSDGSFRRAAGHKGHENGRKVDITIAGATNSTRSDYNFDKAVFCLKAFFNSGAERIGFQDFKRQSELSSRTGGDIRNWNNHYHHFHVEY